MTGFLTFIIFFTAILAVVIVLMQPTKSSGGLGGLGGGGGGGDSVLGTSRNEVLSTATWWLMGVFVVSCLCLGAIKSSAAKAAKAEGAEESVFEKQADKSDKTAPAIENKDVPKPE
jgi:protein translocase SecG subunit